MEGPDRPSHSLNVLFAAISACDHHNIPAADCQWITLLDGCTLLQYDFSSCSLINIAVGGDDDRSDHHFTCNRACNGNFVGGIIEQIRHVLAEGIHTLTNRDLARERGSGNGNTSMFHSLAHNRTNGIGVKQRSNPLGIALAECVTAT